MSDNITGGPFFRFPLEKLFETAAAILYVYDVQSTRNVFQNHPLGKVLGYPDTEWPERPQEWQTLIHPDDALKFTEHLARLRTLTEGESVFWEYRLRHCSGNWRWFVSHDSLLARDDKEVAQYVVGTATDITAQKQAEEQTQLLFLEMRHRSKNFATIIDAIARQMHPTLNAQAIAAVDSFSGRLRALLSAGEAALSTPERHADFGIVAKEALAPFSDGSNRVRMSGGELIVPEATAGALALALHELATNALKYGALSVPGGSVWLRWWHHDQVASIEWKERGGPRVLPPTHEGFGTRLIKSAAARDRLASVALNYEPDGLRCRFEFGQPS